MGDADAENLLGQDMVDTLLQVRDITWLPWVSRLVISHRKTPDFVNGSRNLTDFFGPRL